MTGYLLDTHAFLWWLTDDKRLGPETKKVLAEVAQKIYVSVVTAWEIEIKRDLGKLRFAGDVRTAVETSGFIPLSLNFFHTKAVSGLEPLHRDPFDRMLLAQSSVEHFTFVTADRAILNYPGKFLVASS